MKALALMIALTVAVAMLAANLMELREIRARLDYIDSALNLNPPEWRR